MRIKFLRRRRRVARKRERAVHQKLIAADFGISGLCLTEWLKSQRVQVRTMPDFAHHRVAELSPMPGVLVVPTTIGAAVEELSAIAAASDRRMG